MTAALPGSFALAQGANTITIVTTGGAAPGSYTITTDTPCRAGVGAASDWAIDVPVTGAMPASLYVAFSPETPAYNYLLLSMVDTGSADGTYQWNYESPGVATVEDRGDSATLTLTASNLLGYALDGSDGSGGTAVVTVECTVIDRLQPAPETTPPPASGVPTGTGSQGLGTNSVHIETTGGPAPGTYDVTTDEPCQAGVRGLTDWALSIQDTGTDPSSMYLGFGPDDPLNNFVSLRFGPIDAAAATYDTNYAEQGEATVDDRGDSATLTLTAANLWGTAADGADVPGGSVVVTVECNAIERIQSAPTPMPTLPPPPSLTPFPRGFSARVEIVGGLRAATYDLISPFPCVKATNQYGQTRWDADSDVLTGPPPFLAMDMLIGGEEGYDQDDILIDFDFRDMFYRISESSATRYQVDDRGATATIQVVGVPSYLVRGTQEQGSAEGITITVLCSVVTDPSGQLVSPSP